MKEEKGKAVVPANTGAVAVPDFMREDIGKGGLETGNEGTFGFVKLLQALSPEVDAKLFDSGNMINSLSQTDYGKELTFIPLVDIKQAIKWNARDKGGGIACNSVDAVNGKLGACATCMYNYDGWKRGDLTKEEKQELCTLYLNFPSLINGEDMPTIVNFEKTKYKIGAKLKSLYLHQIGEMGGNMLPLFSMKFRLVVKEDKRPLGKFYNYDVSFAGMTSKEEYMKAKKWADAMKKVTIKMEAPATEEKPPF